MDIKNNSSKTSTTGIEAVRLVGGNFRKPTPKSKNSNRNRSKSRSGQQVQCWNCGKTGHFRNQCKSPKKKNEIGRASCRERV